MATLCYIKYLQCEYIHVCNYISAAVKQVSLSAYDKAKAVRIYIIGCTYYNKFPSEHFYVISMFVLFLFHAIICFYIS